MASYVLLVFLKTLTIFLTGSVIDAKRSICGDIHLVKEKGIIRSPNYPHSYPNSTNCTWTILSPPYSVLTLVVKDVDIADDKNCLSPPCCRNNVLQFPVGENDIVHRVCGHNKTVKPVHLSQHETVIQFLSASSEDVKSRGFLLSYFIEPFPPGPCPSDKTRCAENSDHCFTTSSERCDGAFHCPNGEDEAGCDFKDVKNDIVDLKISNRDKCVHQSLWCDGNYVCDINSDEEACLRNSVVSATIMGCLFCGLLLVIAMMCGLRLYTMNNNENSSNYRIQIPAHIASRFSLNRYISLPELIDNDFFHREPPPSYSIAVGQSNVNTDGLPRYSRRALSWRQRTLTPVKPPTPPPSSETSNQSSPSRDSVTSSSYLSNDENIRLVNTEN